MFDDDLHWRLSAQGSWMATTRVGTVVIFRLRLGQNAGRPVRVPDD
jgi:hypothetical protein